MRLEKQVEVAARFQRSVRLDTDLESASALDGFLCTHSFERALRTVAESHQATGHGAFTWTGPYGGGKSVLALALAQLVGPKGRRRQQAEAAIGAPLARLLSSAFKSTTRSWVTVAIVGAREPAHALIWEALCTARLVPARAGSKAPSAREVVQALGRIAQKDASGGVLLIIDELGKVLEGAAISHGDVQFLQDVAELASRSSGRLVVLGILHQAFEEYAARLGKQAQDEWAKVQGRFIDVPLAPTGNEQIELLARAITSRGAPRSYSALALRIAGAMRKYRPGAAEDISATLSRCWPLHPVTACLLGPISRRRFGQNQRSLFAFLNSREPAGFQDFLRHAGPDELFGPEQLFDYLQMNLEPAILASPDGHRWSLAIDACERAEKRGGSRLELSLLKGIALLDLFRERSGLYASKEVLVDLHSDVTPKTVEKSLNELRQWSVVAYREHLGAYAIFAGSDFDLQAALDDSRKQIAQPDLKAVRHLANLRPVVAKRHYHETGAFRWFEVDVLAANEVEHKVAHFLPNGSIGQILMIVPTAQESERALQALAVSVTQGAEHPCLVGICGAGDRIAELTMEMQKLEYIRLHHPQLRDDTVARREVDARSATAAHILESEVRTAFATARFYYKGENIGIQGSAGLSKRASEIASEVYSDSPRIISELLNRDAPSSNAVAAMKALLKAMISRQSEEFLGIQSFPPERGLYDSVLMKTGLHSSRAGDVRFRAPDSRNPSRLHALWRATDEYLERAAQSPVTAAQIYEFFGKPPFGIRSGLRAILLVAYLQSRIDRYTLYVDGVLESALTEFGIDRLVMDAGSLSLRVFDPSLRQKQLIDGIRKTLAKVLGEESLRELTDTTAIARALVALVKTQPTYVLRTASLSKTAAEVRSALRAATDPNVLLHETLPATLQRLIGKAKPALQEEIALLEAALEEIAHAYERMLRRVDECLRVELGVEAGADGLTSLAERASRVRHLTGDLRLDAFAGRLSAYTGDRSAIEGLASLALSKPARDWTDNEVDAALLHVAAMAQQFNRAEAFARVKGRPDGRHAISIVIGLDRAPTILAQDFEIPERDRKQVLDIARKMTSAVQGARREVVLAALAQVGRSLMSDESEAPPRVANQ